MEPHRIMIVGDDPDFRAALAEAMREAGAEVEVAGDSLEALQRLRAGPSPAVVLLDLRLADLACDELLRWMRADPRLEHVPVITMSGGSAEPRGRDIAARLHKPVDLHDLRQIVASLLDG